MLPRETIIRDGGESIRDRREEEETPDEEEASGAHAEIPHAQSATLDSSSHQ